jgi:type IV pilus assembly protein PilW
MIALHSRQRGLTLIELMIAMALGLILSLAIGQVFMSSRHTNTSQEANARIQENARFAFHVMERELRMAGFVRNGATNGFTPAIRPVGFSDGTGSNGSDEFTVRFQGSDNPAGTGPDNTVFNCAGEPARNDQMVVDRFYVAPNASGEPALFCDAVRPSDTTVTTAMADNVVSVRLSLLLRSQDRVIEGVESRRFNHFGEGYAPGNVAPAGDAGAVFNQAGAGLDSRMRRLYQTNVALRNRLN